MRKPSSSAVGMAGLVDAGVDRPAHVLDEGGIEPVVDLADLEVAVQSRPDLHRSVPPFAPGVDHRQDFIKICHRLHDRIAERVNRQSKNASVVSRASDQEGVGDDPERARVDLALARARGARRSGGRSAGTRAPARGSRSRAVDRPSPRRRAQSASRPSSVSTVMSQVCGPSCRQSSSTRDRDSLAPPSWRNRRRSGSRSSPARRGAPCPRRTGRAGSRSGPRGR